MSKKGVIYILTNPSFKEYVKIGYATDIEKRLKTLNRSETIPFAFRVYATYDVDAELTDKELHRLIDMLNPDLRTIETFDGKTRTKEFYAMQPEEAYSLLESIAKISGTSNRLKRMKPEGHEILDEQTAQEVQEEARRGPFRFSAVNIPFGSKIQYISDPSIKAIVVDDRHIEYDGETTSLTALATRLKGAKRALQGPLYFTYENETLAERRNRMEKEEQ
jgi:hypothetical protein